MSNKKQVFIQCPVCKKSGKIEVPKKKIEEKSSGLSIIIVKKLICEHVFLAYIDKNFIMRESEEVYYVPSPEIIEKSKEIKEEFFDDHEMVMIQMNLYPLTLSYILKCFLNNQSVGIILEENQDFLKPTYEKLFNYLFNRTFEINYQILSEYDYSNLKNELDLPIIIKNVEILKDEHGFLTENEFAVERGFINKFYNENYGRDTLKALKLEINNAFMLANTTKNYITNNKKLNLNKIIKYLENEFKINVDIKYAEFLLEIIKNYFNLEVKSIYKNVEFLKFKKLSK